MNKIKNISLDISFQNYIKNQDFRLNKLWLEKDFYIISDPPYNQGYNYHMYEDKLSPTDYIQLLHDAFSGMKSIVVHYPEQTVNILPEAIGGKCSEVVAWTYNSMNPKEFRLISFWNCKPDLTRLGQPYKNPKDPRIKNKLSGSKPEANLTDKWEIQQVRGNTKKKIGNPHPCPIPYELARRIILTTTNIGDTICDPFGGSGAILKAAHDLKRKYVGFEIDEIYFNYMKTLGL